MTSTDTIPTHPANDAEGPLLWASLHGLYYAMGIPKRAQTVLTKRYRIQSLSGLKAMRQRLGCGELQGVKRKIQKQLAYVIDYIEEGGVMGLSGGDDEELVNVEKGIGHVNVYQFICSHTRCAEQRKIRYSRFKECLRGYDKARDEAFLRELTDAQLIKLCDGVAESTTFYYLCPDLCKMSWCQPILRKFINGLMRNLPSAVTAAVVAMEGDNDDDSVSNQHCIVCYGKTQSGKTGLKAVAAALCLELGIDFQVLTKGLPESRELTAKLKKYFSGCHAGDLSRCVISTLQYDTANQIVNKFPKRMILVAFDTETQIEKAIHALKGPFILVVDEADSMYRSASSTQKAEIAYAKLRKLGPKLTVMTTATPLSILGILEEKKCPFELFSVGTTDDYVGLEDMEPLVSNDVPQFLSDGLKQDKWVAFEGDTVIPYTNHQTTMLYNDAACGANSKKGILLLDITIPRVSEEDKSIYTKGEYLRRFYAEKAIQIFVVVNVGDGIYINFGGDVPWRKCGESSKLSDVLNHPNERGLHVPIFVLGFFKMTRGVSCRSDLRVPTHIVAALGKGYSIENVLQAMGRATFNGKATLEQNVGVGAKVKILTNETDFAAVQLYQESMRSLDGQCHAGSSSFGLLLRKEMEKLTTKLSKLPCPRRLGQRPNNTENS